MPYPGACFAIQQDTVFHSSATFLVKERKLKAAEADIHIHNT